jgi:hypothetical protein
MPLIYVPLYIPYNDNNIWIMGTNNYDHKYIRVGSADFSGVIDRTISYGGNSYGAATSSQYKETELVSCKYSPLNMAVLAYWGLNDVIQSVDEPPTLFTSADGGATWTFRKTFVSYSFIHPRCQALVIHPNNPAYLYMVGNRTEGHILVSSDYGVTFADKTGDWFSKFATVPTRGAELATSGYAQNSGYIYPIF